MFDFRRSVLLLLFAGFFLTSLFGYAGYRFSYQEWSGGKTFYQFRIVCGEDRSVHTMLLKDQDGLWALGGFFAHPLPMTSFLPKGTPVPSSRRSCHKTKEEYRRLQALGWARMSTTFKDKTPYISFPGWNGFWLYPSWRLSQVIFAQSPDRIYFGLWSMRVFSALTTALALWLLCLWIVRETSLFSGLFTGLGMMLLPIMTLLLYSMGNNPMHKPFFHFVPFLLVAFALQSRWRRRVSSMFALRIVAGLACFGVAAKILLGWGYDLLPTVMVTATVPLFWYAIREGWSLRQFSLWFCCCSLAILAGCVIAIVIHGLQVEAIDKDFLTYAKKRFLYRSIGIDKIGSMLRCDDKNFLLEAPWKLLVSCKSHMTVVLDGFRYQFPFLVLCLSFFLFRFVRVDLRARLKDPHFLALFRATLVCVGIGAVAAISQTLIWKQATAIHIWLQVCAWLLMFRPFALLMLALLLEPAFLRGRARVVRLWQQRVDASFRV